MPRTPLFGFEAEFQVNANAVIGKLYDLELAGDRALHSYHCDCEDCDFENGYPFRGQTDSSCSGEIITDILGHPDSEYDIPMLYRALSEAAIEVDAEPGINSGFHVHVNIGEMTQEEKVNAFYSYLRWEPTLSRIAAGRWAAVRQMNTYAREQCARVWMHSHPDYSDLTTGNMLRVEEHNDLTYDCKERLLSQSQQSDRHSNLNTGQRRAPTWEYRLWNSTRSAWRMELFVGLSIALTDPDVTSGLNELAPPRRFSRPSTGMSDVALALANAGFDRISDLLLRQASYLDERAGNVPAMLTTV